ncbi:sulfotransferase domain-containing protein [Desulfohalovibrio reitneri]|uniref:sulfotransferase domain-containing protein n=1 Tax=Desulfohalovibrio reitneri TaxID=1307759 RepID=UPI0004A760FF|nr:sulfotransferase domain-containing protein [Desulfohalovibrio reitneri]
MVRFVIFAEPRSGTTFLNASLNAHPDIRAFGEIMPDHTEPHHFHHYWLKQIERDPSVISLEHLPQVFRRYLRYLASRRRRKAVGVDVKYYQLEWKNDFLPVYKAENFRVVHVVRRNLLRRHVSWLLHQPEIRKALKRPMHATETINRVLLPLPNPNELPQLLNEARARIDHYQRIFEDNFPCLTVDYEAMIDPETNYLTAECQQRLFGFLEVPPLREVPVNPMRKINPAQLRYSLSNYDEVVAALKDTPFRDLLDDPGRDVAELPFHQHMGRGHRAAESDLPAALRHYLQAAELAPRDPEPIFHTALVYAATNRRDKAMDLLERVLDLCGDDQMRAFYAKARETLAGGAA